MRRIILITALLSINFLAIAHKEDFEHRIEMASSMYVQNDTNIAILDSILSINLSDYIGKPVDSLLSHLPKSAHVMRIKPADNPNLANRIIITYQNWYWVQIVVDNFSFMNQYDPQRLWDITLFKKETISWIFVDQGNNCVYGCNTERYRN
jgi:hypothetical protein